MKLMIGFGLACGDMIKENKEYFWHTDDVKANDIQQAKYESFINFNKPGNQLYCSQHNSYERIKRITVFVQEFDKEIKT